MELKKLKIEGLIDSVVKIEGIDPEKYKALEKELEDSKNEN